MMVFENAWGMWTNDRQRASSQLVPFPRMSLSLALLTFPWLVTAPSPRGTSQPRPWRSSCWLPGGVQIA